MAHIDVEKTRARAGAKLARQEALAHLDPKAVALSLIGHWPALSTRGQSIAGFWPIYDEIDPRPLMAALAQAGQVTALPRIIRKAHPLEFRQWAAGDPLDKGPYGTREPSKSLPVISPNIVLVPLLTFTAGGYRLGYGGGFYDRTIGGLRKRAEETSQPFFACGLAYDGQEAASVPTDNYDQKLDAILTETGFRTFP